MFSKSFNETKKVNMHSQVFFLAAFAGVAVAAPDHLAARAVTNTALQTTFPKSSGTTNLAAARTLAAGETLDGGMKQWDRSRMPLHFPFPLCSFSCSP